MIFRPAARLNFHSSPTGARQKRIRICPRTVALVMIAATVGAAGAQVATARPPLYDGADGATCDYFNLGARIAWHQKQGDWIDAAGVDHGEKPYALARVTAADEGKIVRWDVTRLVQDWLSGRFPDDGLFIMGVKGSPNGTAQFHSREASDPHVHPVLVIGSANGVLRRIEPIADTMLDCSTYTSLGTRPTLNASLTQRALVQFDLGPFAGQTVTKASLELSTIRSYDGPVDLGVFAAVAPLDSSTVASAPRLGIASHYSKDNGIKRDPAVIMATGFDESKWQSAWTFANPRGFMERTDNAPKLGFEPLVGQALQVTIPAGEHLGLDLGYQFAKEIGTEPEEIFFRYYLRLANDWKPSADGGKLPGISATYSQAGWGGRISDGRSGWSMRGFFLRPPEAGNPFHDLTPVGTYAYHADMKSDYGDAWFWSVGGRGFLARDRWYCIEQQFRVNTPGRKDGVLRAWIDGYLVYEKTDVRVRDVPRIRIEQIWMNVYHGGKDAAASELHLFIDNVVVAREYIGPIGK